MKRKPKRLEDGNFSGALWDVAIALIREARPELDYQTAFALVKDKVRFRLQERGVLLSRRLSK